MWDGVGREVFETVGGGCYVGSECEFENVECCIAMYHQEWMMIMFHCMIGC
jgi:hypothetical protein